MNLRESICVNVQKIALRVKAKGGGRGKGDGRKVARGWVGINMGMEGRGTKLVPCGYPILVGGLGHLLSVVVKRTYWGVEGSNGFP